MEQIGNSGLLLESQEIMTLDGTLRNAAAQTEHLQRKNPFEMNFTVKQNDSYSDSINYILDHSCYDHLHLSSQAFKIIKTTRLEVHTFFRIQKKVQYKETSLLW